MEVLKADCAICGKKLGFMGGNLLENRVPNVSISIGGVITVCDECLPIMKKLKAGNFDAYYTIHKK